MVVQVGPGPEAAVPSRDDPTLARASAVAGGPLGRYARYRASWWTPVRVLLAIAAFTLLLGYGEKLPCADGNWVASKQYTHACYSDVIPLWSAEGLDRGQVPYRDHPVEYPVLTGGFMYVSAEATRAWHALAGDGWLPGHNETIMFGVITCALLGVCGLLAVYATAGAAGPRRFWDAAIFAASPLLVFHAFSNWDLLAMAFASGALWAWARRRPGLAGVLIGLGTAAKLYPVLLLVPIALLAYRTRRWQPAAQAVAGAAASWLVVNLPIALAWNPGWKVFYTFSEHRPAEASTVWAMLNHYYPHTFGTPGESGWTPPGAAVALLLLLALAAVGYLALTVPARPRLAQLAFLSVAAFLLTTKVWSPQYSLWLVPLLALARPRWRMALIWQASEIAVWVGTLLWLLAGSDPNKAMTYEGLTWLLLIRDAVLLVLVGLIVREMYRPATDPVRTSEEPDPGAGVFADADADRLLGRRRSAGTLA
ncbi:MAG TPA: glycosyltransferase 87 family protein [Jatrophihabitans sp.]|nr:glycosyltransferase 87 family protein [Jatrophihabitans sp.]